ncbi:hypothetical protein [Pelagerythrobacter aerophilus]|uniref:Uncharacterized protein n=1 Tax=Pelagerythrobacter aerophilus TaxID=2306995 RepID=A0A418NKY8_9SPHN|nr:hypothetical protein [Pelagerythrobacter aerophilus]RIV80315.1 hypothetical protein D2V04_03225 [Pelagerythrobacter aerophilus]
MNDISEFKAALTRRELFDRIWSKPLTANAAELGTKPAVLAALAKRLDLPQPGSGYWTQKELGKAPPTPDYPAVPVLDTQAYAIEGVRRRRKPEPAKPATSEPAALVDRETPEAERLPPAAEEEIEPHQKVAKTRSALRKRRGTERVQIGGPGKFRLFVAPEAGERACAILDRLIGAVEAEGWSIQDAEQGYAIAANGEQIGLMIEERLDQVPHVVTKAELKERAEYDRKCALADRGIGYRPWREPQVPEHDYVPNGELALQFDHDYGASNLRRTFSDGKRQRLENLIPKIMEALERRAAALKASRLESEERAHRWAEQQKRRKDLERQLRVEGYRITFLRRQIERKREVDGLEQLIVHWEESDEADAGFTELLEFARLYRKWLAAKIAPHAIAERVAELKLMDDDVYIYDDKRLD